MVGDNNMNKKGLASGIVVFLISLVIFAVISLVVITMWNQADTAFQGLNESVADNATKQKLSDLGDYILWSDKIFVILFIILFAAYLISSVTLPPDRPIFFLLFMFVLVIAVVLAMLLSNLWEVFIENPNFAYAITQLTFTDYFMTYLPVITFFVGLLGGVLFYSRGAGEGSEIGGDPRGFE